MGYVNWILFFFLVGFLMIGAEMYKSDQELGIERDIYNYTEETVIFQDINISESYPIERTRGIINMGRVYLILDSFVEFLLTSTEQLVKMGIEYGYQNPNINYQQIWDYLVIILIVIIISTLIKPIGYLIIFIIMLVLWIRDKIKDRRKRRIKKNEEQKRIH